MEKMSKKKDSGTGEHVNPDRDGEPKELQTWRRLIEHCDQLRAEMARAENADDFAAKWSFPLERRRELNEGDPNAVSDEELVKRSLASRAKIAASIRNRAASARNELERIHSLIQSRPRKTVPPEDLVAELLQDKALERALLGVTQYIKSSTVDDEDEAYSSLLEVLRLFNPPAAEQEMALLVSAIATGSQDWDRDRILNLDRLIKDAKQRKGEGYSTPSRVARCVVALVSGLPLGSRQLRRLNSED